jgi:predicted GNAT family N-acyltransferase
MPYEIRQIEHGSHDHKLMLELRYKILRQPLSLNFADGEIASEINDRHLACLIDGNVVACSLIRHDGKTAHIRQVAVADEYQGKGLGRLIMAAAENAASAAGASTFKLHARDSARSFYEKIGYKTDGESFEKLTLKHWLMIKPAYICG